MGIVENSLSTSGKIDVTNADERDEVQHKLTQTQMTAVTVFSASVDSDDVMVGSVNVLSSPPAQTGKDMTSTPPSSPSVSATLSGAGYFFTHTKL